MEERLIVRRNRTKQSKSLAERLLEAASHARLAAAKLPAGSEREILLRSAVDSEAAAAIDKWLSSPGLRPPR